MAIASQPGSGTVDTYYTSQWVNGSPSVTLTIASPRAGRSASSTGLIFDLSSVMDYTWSVDSTVAGTTLVATGSSTGGTAPSATAQSPAPVGGLGQMPRLDQHYSFTNISSQAQIASMAQGLAQTYGSPVSTPQITIPTTNAQTLGSWVPGDDARLVASGDEYFPNGLDEYWRIVEYQTTVPDEGVASIQLTFNTPPVI
jgi:hypothetical protein